MNTTQNGRYKIEQQASEEDALTHKSQVGIEIPIFMSFVVL